MILFTKHGIYTIDENDGDGRWKNIKIRTEEKPFRLNPHP